jgi:hypothetical protein
MEVIANMVRKLFLCGIVLLLYPVMANVKRVSAQELLDGSNRIFLHEFLDNLVGDWKLTRKLRGRTAENSVKAEWTLNHQFLLVHMKDVSTPPNYEAMVFIGYDNTSEVTSCIG